MTRVSFACFANRYLRFFVTRSPFLQGSISQKLGEQIFLKPSNISQQSIILIWNTKYHFATKLRTQKRSVVNSNDTSCEMFLWTIYFSSETPSLAHNLLKISQGHSTHITSGAERANRLYAGTFHLHITWKCNFTNTGQFFPPQALQRHIGYEPQTTLCVFLRIS